MSEIIFKFGELLSSAIYHVFMIAVIAFVGKEFGFIQRATTSEAPREPEKPTQGLDLNSLLGGIMKQMGPALQGLSAPGVPTEETPPAVQENASAVHAAKPVLALSDD